MKCVKFLSILISDFLDSIFNRRFIISFLNKTFYVLFIYHIGFPDGALISTIRKIKLYEQKNQELILKREETVYSINIRKQIENNSYIVHDIKSSLDKDPNLNLYILEENLNNLD